MKTTHEEQLMMGQVSRLGQSLSFYVENLDLNFVLGDLAKNHPLYLSHKGYRVVQSITFLRSNDVSRLSQVADLSFAELSTAIKEVEAWVEKMNQHQALIQKWFSVKPARQAAILLKQDSATINKFMYLLR